MGRNLIYNNFLNFIIDKSITLSYVCLLIFSFIILTNTFTLEIFDVFISVLYILSILILPGYLLITIIYREYRMYNIIEKLVISIIFSIFIIIFGYIILTNINNLTKNNFSIYILVISTIFYLITFKTYNLSVKNCYDTSNIKIILVLLIIFISSISSRIFFIFKNNPLFLGWDTPGYIRDSIWFIQGLPINYPNGVPFLQQPIVYIFGAIFYLIFQFYNIIPIFISIIDSLSIFSLYLFYKKLINDDRIVIVAVFLYNFSFFSFRFFSDLYRDLILNFILPLGFYFLIDGHDKKHFNKFILSGILFGLALNIHTQALYRITFYLIIYLIISFIFKKNIKLLFKRIFIIGIIMFTLSLPYQIYTSSKGSIITNYNNLISGANTFLVSDSNLKNELLWSIPSPITFLVNESFILLIGSVILIMHGNKKNAFWFILCNILLLLIFELPYIGYYSYISQRAFYYYGVFSYFLKSITIFFIIDSLSSYIYLKKITLTYNNFLNELKINNTSILKFRVIIITGLLLSSSFLFLMDKYSFYPIKAVLPFFEVSYPGRTNPIITQEQYDVLNWIKNMTTNTEIVIVNSHLWGYSSQIFWGSKITSYTKLGTVYSKDQQLAYDLVWRKNLLKHIDALSTNWTGTWIILSKNFDQESNKLIKELKDDSLFGLVYENNVIAVFYFDIGRIKNTLDNMTLKTFISVNNKNYTSSELFYKSYEGTTIFWKLRLKCLNNYNVTHIPQLLFFKSISPLPEKIVIGDNNYIYLEGNSEINYNLTFSSLFPYEQIGWKESAFLSGWFTTSGASLTSNGSIASIQMGKLYDAIYKYISVNSSEYRYLIIKYKVNSGLIELKLRLDDGVEYGLGSVSDSNWTIKIYDLWKIKKGIFTSIKIQGNLASSNFDIDYIYFANTQ